MNIIQLTYFKCFVEEKSVTKAAHRLCVTQSAVSQQIHLLAENLGCELFYKSGRELRVTPDGEFIYQKAKSILSELEGLRDELKSQGDNVFGTLKIGTGPVISKEFLPDIVSAMLKTYPNLSFSLFETHSKNIITSIMESRIDLGLGVINDNDKRIHSEKLLSGRSVLICSSQNEWSSRKSVSLGELKKVNLIRRAKDVEISNPTYFGVNDDEKKFNLVVMNTETIVPYVKRNMGMALAPDYIIKLMDPDGISVIEFEEEIKLSWGVMRDKSQPFSKAAKVFIEKLKAKLSKLTN